MPLAAKLGNFPGLPVFLTRSLSLSRSLFYSSALHLLFMFCTDFHFSSIAIFVSGLASNPFCLSIHSFRLPPDHPSDGNGLYSEANVDLTELERDQPLTLRPSLAGGSPATLLPRALQGLHCSEPSPTLQGKYVNVNVLRIFVHAYLRASPLTKGCFLRVPDFVFQKWKTRFGSSILFLLRNGAALHTEWRCETYN